ncbi:MAG: bifunctional DNA-formamidopyrimidine glycosylase/DNA-(apurinic or apyrimidinic site) lyase [Deltaproteobacteria bacterium]|jgi:formamidopyrimidine-DNA glycosylase|nr:bifunctional DNA-formamidopyrimidine glycosylase/DNA-(apurinic or apyrimidinic site) lyase [Deltaproteobacteria bacterium]
MPELPEVEVIRRGLENHLPGRKVVAVAGSNKKLRLPVPRKDLKRYILGASFTGVDRRAKFLLLSMDNGATLAVHLGMSGRFGIFPAGRPRAIHDHLRLRLDNTMELRFNDPRRFGFIRVCAPGINPVESMLSGAGPEPLGPDFTAAYLLKCAAGKERPLKNFLMDSRVVVGIGNIYACEILFHAGITPQKKAGTVSPLQWQKVVQSCRHVLARAIASGGTTISDFVNESGKSGYFQLELQVYGRQGEGCRNCSGTIVRKVMAGRATYFCPRCQK